MEFGRAPGPCSTQARTNPFSRLRPIFLHYRIGSSQEIPLLLTNTFVSI